MKHNKLLALTLAVLLLLGCLMGCMRVKVSGKARENESAEAVQDEPAGTTEEVFSAWNEGAPALDTLIDYVEAVTDEDSPDFIPESRRIAVFDMDGTVYAELFPTYLEYYLMAWRILADPTFEPDEEMLAAAHDIRAGGPTHTYAADMAVRHATQAARAYAGMTLNEFSAFVTSALVRDADGFTGMTYGEAFYQPMVEVIDYLTEN
ncbi:MAG: hypothetical protein IJI85_01535, partial [Clostridia bacterium]|nr:hypothetical protein [Clostridia bacterium]MBR0421250.1 hypothetical protein [Clostridia bacterium]